MNNNTVKVLTISSFAISLFFIVKYYKKARLNIERKNLLENVLQNLRNRNQQDEQSEKDTQNETEINYIKRSNNRSSNNNEEAKIKDNEFISKNEKIIVVGEFKTLVNRLLPSKFQNETDIADDAFYEVVYPIFGNNISIELLKITNTLFARILNIDLNYEYRKNYCETPDADCIQKGDKATEVNMLKESINKIYNDNQLYEDGNYTRELHHLIVRLFYNTPVFSDYNNQGRICKEYIQVLHKLVTNIF